MHMNKQLQLLELLNRAIKDFEKLRMIRTR